MRVDGHTLLYGLVGFPVSHSRSPAMLNAAFDALGMNAVYLPFELPPESLAEGVRGLAAAGVKGFNVTIPHKRAVIGCLDAVSDEAALIGAVNTVIAGGDGLRGENTDGRGFVRALESDLGFGLEGATVLLLGAGGAGRAIGVMAAVHGAASLRVADIDEGRARDLAETVNSRVGSCLCETVPPAGAGLKAALDGVGLFVDATPIGMKPGDGTSIDVGWLGGETVVYDLVYNPPVTGLIASARAAGLRAANGAGMLLYQGASALELWTGEEAPVGVMRAALEDGPVRP